VAIAIDTPAEVRAWSDAARASSERIAIVPTMGALHQGHLELIASAAGRADRVIVSVFVNPLQFGEGADFEHYPRPLDDDLRACDDAGVDVVYVPTVAAMYPDGFSTTVNVAGLSELMEGASRPGHFDGVTTVVTKLFAATRPDVAVFGQKDFQQLAIVRRLVRDLDLGVYIIGHPIVREHDGLALSSRNRRLSAPERAAAICIPAAISAALEYAASADSTVDGVIRAARAAITSQPLAALDYVEVFDSSTLCPLRQIDEHQRRPGAVRIAIAVRVGSIRLIDNADLFDAFE
jgi:pantoate--beta-alanine ligase